MTAQIVEKGYEVGYAREGQEVSEPCDMVHWTFPSNDDGEYTFAVIFGTPCLIRGLPQGEGYIMRKLPVLQGNEKSWSSQIAEVMEGIPTLLVEDMEKNSPNCEHVLPVNEANLWYANGETDFYLIAS